MEDRGKIVALRKVAEEIEAVRLKAFLEGEGIECQVHSFYDSALDGISTMWGPAEGCWGEIRVFEEDLPRAQLLLEDLAKSRPLDEDRHPPEEKPPP